MPGWLSGGLGGAETSQPYAGTGAGMAERNGSQDAVIPHRDNAANYPVDQYFTVLCIGAGKPVMAPGFRVPPGCTVRTRAHNGGAGNSAAVFVGYSREILLSGNGKPLAPLDDVASPVDNTCKIWVMGAVGDGVVISVVSVTGGGLG